MADSSVEHSQAEENPPSIGPRSDATTVTAIMLSVFLMGAGTALQTSAVSLRAGIEGFSESMIGLILSANYVGLMIGSLIAPSFVRTVGYVRSFAAFASLGSVSALAHVLWIHPFPWLVFRTGTGFCLAVMLIVVESWLNSSTSNYNRGRILSIYSVVYLGSMGAGQPLLGAFPPAAFEIFGVTTILISLCLVPVALMRVGGQAETEWHPPRLISTFQRSPLAGTGILVSGLVTGATWSLTPRFAQQIGLAGNQVGLLMLLISLGTLTIQWPLGRMSDRQDRRQAILLSAGVALLLALVIAIGARSAFVLSILVFLFGGFSMPLYSLSIALANDQLSPAEMVNAAGAIVLYYGIGSAVGPFLASLVMTRIGPGGLFLFMGAILGVLVALAALRISIVPMISRRRRSEYRPYPRTTSAAFALLRRVAKAPVRGTQMLRPLLRDAEPPQSPAPGEEPEDPPESPDRE
jgi:MFS family permease